LTKGKIVVRPSLLKYDNLTPQENFYEIISLHTVHKEDNIPDILEIHSPKWIQINYQKANQHEILLHLNGLVPNYSGKYNDLIVIRFDSMHYSSLEIPVSYSVDGLIVFDNPQIIKVIKKTELPFVIDVTIHLKKTGIVSSVSLISDDVVKSSVIHEIFGDSTIKCKISLRDINRKLIQKNVIRTSLEINVLIDNILHTANLPILLILSES
jgi:hypothetical protein